MTQEEFSEKFLSHLNKQQKEAIQAVDGAVLLLAVPGSGKTTVLVTRLGYMVYCRDIAPRSILTMTYTVAATKEMQQRFSSMFGSEYAEILEFRTINGLSAKIINYYSRNYGKGSPFELLDNGGELARMVGRIYQEINDEYATESTIKDIRSSITYIKNMMLTKEGIDSLDVGILQMPQIYNQYCSELKQRRLMDYDDQMSYALNILKSVPAVLEHFQEKYRYICVDEAQDTSKIQHTIIHLLAQKYSNIFMVGDEDQSIYGFRAAYPDALMSFSKNYPKAKVLLIEYNYRSTKEIVTVANAFVLKNKFRYKKVIKPTRGNGLPIQVIQAADRSTQYKYLFTVAQTCETETAVLFRNNDSALPLIDMLERNSIPYNYRQLDGVFFSNRIVVDITDIINFAYNPHDADAFMRVYYKFGKYLNKIAAIYACEQSKRSGKPILDELINFPELSSFAKEGVISLLALLPMITKSNGIKAVQLIWNTSGYGQYVTANKLDAGKFATLCMLGENEASPRDLLRRLKELRDIIQNHKNSNSNQFILSTIHSSKGLEYDRVFLLDIFDGILPSKADPDVASQEEIKQYEEDRRLYYVGMTRARNELYLFNCRNTNSAFTSEVLRSLPRVIKAAGSASSISKRSFGDKTYTHKDEAAPKRKSTNLQGHIEEKEKARQTQELESLLLKMTAGGAVTHRVFGKGVITENDGTYVTIRFRSVGEKKFNLIMAVQHGVIEI